MKTLLDRIRNIFKSNKPLILEGYDTLKDKNLVFIAEDERYIRRLLSEIEYTFKRNIIHLNKDNTDDIPLWLSGTQKGNYMIIDEGVFDIPELNMSAILSNAICKNIYEYQLNSKNSYFDIDELNFVIFTKDAKTIPSALKKIMTVVRCIDFGKFMVIKEDTENE